jgi:uncharacterized protein YjdB
MPISNYREMDNRRQMKIQRVRINERFFTSQIKRFSTLLAIISISASQISVVQAATTDNPAIGVVQVGEATVTPTSFTAAGAEESIAWSSSDDAKATINATTGVITAVAAGATTISYSVKDADEVEVANGSLEITVQAAATTDNPAIGVVQVGEATVTPTSFTAAGAGESIAWSSSDGTKATINATTGVITAVAAGATTISYSVTNDETSVKVAKGSLEITVVSAPISGGGSPGPSAPSAPALKNQSAITLTSSVTTIEFGGSFTVSAKGGESTGGISYASSGDALCAIDASGNVSAVGKGTCTITATRAGDATYASATSNSVTVTVTDNVVPGVIPTTDPAFVPTMSIAKPVKGVTTARIKIDTFYAGDRVTVLLGKKVGNKTTYRTLGSATVSATGQVTYKSKVALSKGSILRLKLGSEVIFSRTIK